MSITLHGHEKRRRRVPDGWPGRRGDGSATVLVQDHVDEKTRRDLPGGFTGRENGGTFFVFLAPGQVEGDGGETFLARAREEDTPALRRGREEE